jgi:serine/threonine-protein kinase
VARDQIELQGLHLFAAPPRPSELAPVSPALDAVVQRAMGKDPTSRYASAAAFLEALRTAVDPSRTRPAEPAELDSLAALHVVVQFSPTGSRADEPVDSMLAFLEEAEARVTEAGFTVPASLQTGSALLALRGLPRDHEQAARARAEIERLAESVLDLAATYAAAVPGLHAGVAIHVDLGRLDGEGAGAEVVGPVVRVGRWAPAEAMTGVFRTEAWRLFTEGSVVR